jgi:hypothetical protein
MEDWVTRAVQRWPNVPALFGWLKLDRRGRWLIRGETISRPQIIDTINANYACDEHGRWFFQNGPQRGYMELDYAPLILRASADGTRLSTHTGLEVTAPSHAFLDETGALVLQTEHGPGLLEDSDLPWALERLSQDHRPIDDTHLEVALALPSGESTRIEFQINAVRLPLIRLDSSKLERRLNFVRDPQPRDGERVSTSVQD